MVATCGAVEGAGHRCEGGARRWQRRLAWRALQRWSAASTDDLVAAVDAATLTAAQHSGAPGHSAGDAERAAVRTVEVAEQVRRWGWPAQALAPVDWAPFGAVIPVLAASPGCGASVVAAALCDVLALAGRSVLLADTADPSRSGLAGAVRTHGPVVGGPHPSVRIRLSWRAQALVASMCSELPIISPGMVPDPVFWLPPKRRIAVTVVDVGHDAWRVSANPLIGAGAWLRAGSPATRPVLVCRASQPSLAQAEQLLARMQAFTALGVVTEVAQLVVVGAHRWPPGVTGCAGRRLAGLVESAVFVPHDKAVATSGVTAEVTPARVRRPLEAMGARWGLLDG